MTTAGGHPVRLAHAQDDDARISSPLPPGGTVRAAVRWSAHCGPPLGAYRMAITFERAARPLPLDAHPVPPCDRPGAAEGEAGSTSSSWLEVVDRPARD